MSMNHAAPSQGLAEPALDPEVYRKDFPILHQDVYPDVPLVFLDNAASTQRPNAVIDAISDCYQTYYANVHRGVYALSERSTSAFEVAREIVARFIHSPSIKQVIFTAGSTAAINTIARTWGEQNVAQDDVILLTMMEHHANIVPWHQLAERVGCRVEFLPITDDGRIDLELAEQTIKRLRPKLFSLTAVSNVLGTINPIETFAQIAHRYGALICVDAAQGAPHQEIDVGQLDVDFLVFSGHKVCGPNGIGVLWGREELLRAMPPFLGGGAMIRQVTTTGFLPADIPEKFEAGTPPIVEAIALGKAIEYVQQVGLSRIHQHEQKLASLAHQRLEKIPGYGLLGRHQSTSAGSSA